MGHASSSKSTDLNENIKHCIILLHLIRAVIKSHLLLFLNTTYWFYVVNQSRKITLLPHNFPMCVLSGCLGFFWPNISGKVSTLCHRACQTLFDVFPLNSSVSCYFRICSPIFMSQCHRDIWRTNGGSSPMLYLSGD